LVNILISSADVHKTPVVSQLNAPLLLLLVGWLTWVNHSAEKSIQ